MNPIELAARIEERYRRYLKTTFYFRDPALRASFEEALRSGHLSSGPYLEATRVFRRGQTPQDLFSALLGSEPDQGFLKAMEGDRSLYQHQEEAIRGVLDGRNVIIATGTGSGKTEAFLYPILLLLYREFLSGNLSSGVRALILYPMNALANDQRERLGEICRRLSEFKSPFGFTFGQYIGETPEDEHDTYRHARDHLAEREQKYYYKVENGHLTQGELVLRSEMRRKPPHILLTNYSMLEYLLLRPHDSPLFDNGQARRWAFLVLDEAHQYRGSRGIEMAMLLRRLKRRLREGGRAEPFRCIATSATLAGGEGDREAVARFASDLFDESFREGDVILGSTETIPESLPSSLPPDAYHVLEKARYDKHPEDRRRVAELAGKLGVALGSAEHLPKIIAGLLQRDGRAGRLRRLITSNPAGVREVASQIFQDLPGDRRISALSSLMALLLQSKDPASEGPLFSARYHLFLRSLEGAFVSYWPEKKVFLDRKVVGGEQLAFEVALCRECGQHYFVGRKDFKGGTLEEAIRDPSELSFGASFFRPIEDGAGGDHVDGKEPTHKEVFGLCILCGDMRRGGPKCGHGHTIRVAKEDSPKDEDRADQMARCGACGYSAAGRDPVRELVHGADGPNAVIATTLYQALPEKRRKVLAFADGRQEAAFFAWYLENSFEEILSRNLVLRVVEKLSQHAPEGLSFGELAMGLRDAFREENIFPAAKGDLELRREAWLRLYREFLTDEPRISLEGVGLVRWLVMWPAGFKITELLKSPPWSLTEQEAFDLMSLLLDSMRADKAVELRGESGISLHWSDLDVQASQRRVRIGEPKGHRDVRSWDGRTGRRLRFMLKLLERIRPSLSEREIAEQAVAALRDVWEHIRRFDEDAPSSHDQLLISVDDARRLNPLWWRLRPIGGDGSLFQCVTCARVQAVSVRAVCPRPSCPGFLEEVLPRNLEPNHYRLLYEDKLPGPLRVEEHTAQLDKERARGFQRDFRKGKIHVLSCSTTFELGVDLGDLDTIFLRNVPPEAFNYAQRVGRAGRRSGFPGFAITYCRRAPHDLYHFAEPERMLRGKVRPPALSLRNEKIIIRHIAATALSEFFRAFRERFGTTNNLFKDLANPCGVSDFLTFLLDHRPQLEKTLRATVPGNVAAEVGLEDGSWIAKIGGKESRLALAEAELSSDYRTVKELEVAAASRGDYDTAKWARARAKTMSEEDVPSFLSRKAAIPKYGFPVDVVELDTQRTGRKEEGSQIMLQRDLSIAISEFAPTSRLVANKKVWTSRGLKRVAEKEWPRKLYKRCIRHNLFRQWERGQPEPASPCEDRLTVFQYIIPRFGFVTDRDGPEEPTSRPRRVFTTRPYFADFRGPDPGTISLPAGSPLITVRKSSPGLMTVLCEGRRGEGFYVCRTCGVGFRRRERNHATSYGDDCHGTLEQVSLGHEFVTDVVQFWFEHKPERGMEPVWFAFSLAYALVEGAAEVLEVPGTDLNATVGHAQERSIPPIILYDNVPGGAGLVARLEGEEILRVCLEAAQKRVRGDCRCNESTSCYGCLRSYRNQFIHQHLQRGPVTRYLEAVLSEWQ